MKSKVFITITACIALAACLMTGCTAQSQATENSSSVANTSPSISAPVKAPTAQVTFTVEDPDFTSDSSAAVAHIKKLETDDKADKKSANVEAESNIGSIATKAISEGAEAASEATKNSDSAEAADASENASGASKTKVVHEFYHAVNRENEEKAIELDEGTYEITWVSPINIDGAIYETPNEPQTITVKAGEPVEVKVAFTKINAEDVTAKQLTSIMEQLNEAVKHGDDTLAGEAGKEIVSRAANNAANAPQANTEAIAEVRKEAETSAMTSAPVAPSASAAATTNSNNTGYTNEPSASQSSTGNTGNDDGSANSGSSNVNTTSNSGNNSANTGGNSNSAPAKQKTWVPEQGHYEDIYETIHVPAVTHEEPVYETIVDQEAYTTTTRIYYTRDGWSGSDREEARVQHAMAGGHLGWEDIEEYHPAITHQEQTGTTTVVDVPAHDEQQKTGSKWVVDVEGHWE